MNTFKPFVQFRQSGKIWKAGNSICGLCAAYNHATDPDVLMDEFCHNRANKYARAIRNRMVKLGFIHGRDYKEMTSGIYWPIKRKQ